MKLNNSKPLVIAISSGALFDTRDEEKILDQGGLDAFFAHRKDSISEIFLPGTAFPLIKSLLSLNPSAGPLLIDTWVVSHNDPSCCLKVTKSIQAHKLLIEKAIFCGGEDVIKDLQAADVDLFLSRNLEDVRKAIAAGIPAARVYDPPQNPISESGELRIAFDGDAVLFSDEAEKIYQKAKVHAAEQGLDSRYPVRAFIDHELSKREIPLQEGPIARFAKAISRLQLIMQGQSGIKIKVALITARSLPSHERALISLNSYGVKLNKAVFLGGTGKAPFVKAFDPHIFFDDQDVHLSSTCALSPSAIVPAGRVAYGFVNQADIPVVKIGDQSVVSPVVSLPNQDLSLDRPSLTKADFQIRVRSILLPYTALGRSRNQLDNRFRDFIAKNADRPGQERYRILEILKRYDLQGLETHDPMLNRELGDIVANKLNKVIDAALDSNQGHLSFG